MCNFLNKVRPDHTSSERNVACCGPTIAATMKRTTKVSTLLHHYHEKWECQLTQESTVADNTQRNRTLHTQLHFSVLTSMLAQCSSMLTLTYTTQVRSSGSQVCVGNRNHRADPVPVLRRAPTLSDEQRQQRVGLRALSPSEHLPKCAKERPRESQGDIQGSPAVPEKAQHRV